MGRFTGNLSFPLDRFVALAGVSICLIGSLLNPCATEHLLHHRPMAESEIFRPVRTIMT